jgi:large subunit ribosomal protein L18
VGIDKKSNRIRRHKRIKKKIQGTAERPRLSVYRSIDHIYAQIIDDIKRRTLISASTLSKELNELRKSGGNVEAAKLVGKLIAQKALERGVSAVVFDRGGYLYHGRVKALAEAAREAGLKF